MKKKFYTEAAYFLGLLILAFGTALMVKADMGMSMVVAPAYLVHRKLSVYLPWFSFGVAEYTFQAVLLVGMILFLRRFRIHYLFSFVTAVLYGILLDICMFPASFLPTALPARLAYFILGMLLGSLGVALLFHTYIAPEVYELFVKEWADQSGMEIGKCKTVYDCISCALSILLSFAFFGVGHFEGVKLGTVVCALCNGRVIGIITGFLNRHYLFTDSLRKGSSTSRP